jgi:hypothetical protein
MRRIAILAACLSLGLGTAEASAPSGSASAPPAPSSAPAGGPTSWEGATPLAIARPHELCKGVRLGDWGRITCGPPGFIMDVYLMGGSHEGVSFREAKAEKGVHIVFPMREGDRREFAVSIHAGTGYTVEEDVAIVISELWLPGMPAPEIVIADNPR